MDNIVNFLNNHLQQIIVIGLPVAVSFIVYFLGRRRKSLSYEIVSSVPLLTVKEALEGKLQLLFESNPVKNVEFVIIRVINSGKITIKKTDYELPLKFIWGEGAKVLSAEIIKKDPDSIVTSVSINKDNFEFAPTMLNCGDTIEVKVFVSDYKGKLIVEARIIGIKKVEEIIRFLPRGSLMPILGALAIMFVGLALYRGGFDIFVPAVLIAGGFVALIAVIVGKVFPYFDKR